jgi:hypothetical protein
VKAVTWVFQVTYSDFFGGIVVEGVDFIRVAQTQNASAMTHTSTPYPAFSPNWLPIDVVSVVAPKAK